MKTFKLFLASSLELEEERVRVGNLVRQLNEEWRKRALPYYLDLEVWEDESETLQPQSSQHHH